MVKNMLVTFDTYACVKELTESGVPLEQAEIHAKPLQSLLEKEIATKQNIELVRKDIAIGVKTSIITLGGLLIGLFGLMFAYFEMRF